MVLEAAALLKGLQSAFTWAIGRAAGAGADRVKEIFKDRAAKTELTEIAVRAVEAAIGVAPPLADGLRSEYFLQTVLAPAMLDMLREPTQGLRPERLIDPFMARFVEPYSKGEPVGEVLSDGLGVDRDRLKAAFTALISAFRSNLYTSKHWREPIHDSAVEEIRLGVLGLAQALPISPSPQGDLGSAREDARTGSDGLRSWPQTIQGLYLDRPELAALHDRIRETPRGTTLVTGPSGAGKSALLARLTEELEADGMTVFAIKADLLPADVANLKDVARALGMVGDITAEIEALAAAGPVVLIIDQLDAVSDVMDRSSQRMRLLLQLANRWREERRATPRPPVHVVISSRPFEASHDARFQTLEAHEVALSLPRYEEVAELLEDLGLRSSEVPDQLHETLRRPFMLKLYVDLAQRGRPLGSLAEGGILNAWLASAQLGDDAARAQVHALLSQLAAEMTQTETLWRPADKFEAEAPHALQRAEACELIVRKGDAIGFAHQAWLDDFQARGFLTGLALAEYAWSAQEGLFGRATLLRSLERLRRLAPSAYTEALDALLGQTKTRRHIRHLVVDFVAAQPEPTPREAAWVQRLTRDDVVLARRAIAKIVDHWQGWRASLAPTIRRLARQSDLKWAAIGMGIAEAKLDPPAAEKLLNQCWSGPDQDLDAFEVCWRGPLWSPPIRARVAEILQRNDLNHFAVSHYATSLAEIGKADAAAELVGLYLRHARYEKQSDLKLHGLEKIAEAAPQEFVEQVLPWFAQLLRDEASEGYTVRGGYPRAASLPLDWQFDDGQGSVFALLQKSLELIAQNCPSAFLQFIPDVDAIELDEAQALIAEGFAAGGELLAEQAIDWLLADHRRLQVGIAHVQDEENVGRMVYDWGTRALLRACTPHVDPAQLNRLVAAIEAFDPYSDIPREERDVKDRQRMRHWADEVRASLLECVPSEALPARRQRQIAEICAQEPRLKARRGLLMASFVGSPMTDAQMAMANDSDLFKMLDELHDKSGHESRRFLSGGVSQLAQAFGAFSKSHPERAMRMAREKFKPAHHERAAGAMVRELGGQHDVAAEALTDLIRLLSDRGFESEDFRRDAAWAFQAIANRNKGLEPRDVQLLESWLETNPDTIADQTARRKDLDQKNRERNQPKEPRPPGAMLFGHRLGGFRVLPHGNFTLLSAAASGLLQREPAAHDQWLALLERHVTRPEDPFTWTVLLDHHGWSLWWADRVRVEALFRALWEHQAEAFSSEGSHFLWRYRGMIPPNVRSSAVLAWYSGGAPDEEQLAGEIAFASRLVDPDDGEMHQLADRVLSEADSRGYLGAVFATASAWREDDPELREKAHSLLLPIARGASGDVAQAISTIVDYNRTLAADDATRELLEAVRDNDGLLRPCVNRHFADALQELLLHPGFETLVLELSERAAKTLLDDNLARTGGILDQDFVSISIALQRSTGRVRERAMDLYERLLDAGVHGADQAARDSLKR